MFGVMPSDQFFLFEVLFERCLWPGLLRARFARFLLRNELSPAYPYRDFLFWVLIQFFGDLFFYLVLFFCGIILLIEIFFWWNYFIGDAFGPGYSGLAKARLPSANQTLRIPIAYFTKFYVLKSASIVLIFHKNKKSLACCRGVAFF